MDVDCELLDEAGASVDAAAATVPGSSVARGGIHDADASMSPGAAPGISMLSLRRGFEFESGARSTNTSGSEEESRLMRLEPGRDTEARLGPSQMGAARGF